MMGDTKPDRHCAASRVLPASVRLPDLRMSSCSMNTSQIMAMIHYFCMSSKSKQYVRNRAMSHFTLTTSIIQFVLLIVMQVMLPTLASHSFSSKAVICR